MLARRTLSADHTARSEIRMARTLAALTLLLHLSLPATAQELPSPHEAAIRAFEQSRWDDAIEEYRRVVEADPADGLALLRIAQAERELDRHSQALETLEQARATGFMDSMIDLEAARDLAALGRNDDALEALEAAEHNGLRALTLLDEAPELAPLRSREGYQRVYRAVRARVFPCESIDAASEFDFWIGQWEVRVPDGTRVGRSDISKDVGGCSLTERWTGAGGSSGSGLVFFTPSRSEWRQVWIGSNGVLIDMTGGWRERAIQMEGTIEYAAEDRVVAFRGSWTPLENGDVWQLLQEFDVVAQTWRTWFDGVFRRRAAP
jgi:hypothetical protein